MAEAPNAPLDERTPLLAGSSQQADSNVEEGFLQPPNNKVDGTSTALIYAVLPTLLLGVFIAQADSSIVLATSQEIASEFSALSGASWLITTYTLAQCACQPLVSYQISAFSSPNPLTWKQYGRMSDIFGRKPVLAFSYIVFALGCILW